MIYRSKNTKYNIKILIIFFVVLACFIFGFWYFSVNSYKSKATFNQNIGFIGRNPPKTKMIEWPFDSTQEIGDTVWGGYMTRFDSNTGSSQPMPLKLTVSEGYLNVSAETEVPDYTTTLLNLNTDIPFDGVNLVFEVEMKAEFKNKTVNSTSKITSNTGQMNIYTGTGMIPATKSSQRLGTGGYAIYTFPYNRSVIGASGKIKRIMFKPTTNTNYYLIKLQINRITVFSRK